MRDEQFVNEAENITREVIDLLVRKGKDYGDEPLKKFGLRGIVMRLHSKIERATTIYFKNEGQNSVSDETTEDTFKDIIGYGILALLMQKGYYGEELKK